MIRVSNSWPRIVPLYWVIVGAGRRLPMSGFPGNRMSEREPYSKAPITEAVIDLRVELPDGFPVTQLDQIQSRLPADYGPGKRLLTGTFAFGIEESGAHAGATQTHQGFRYDRADGKRVLQVKVDGFAYSVVAEYDRWSTFRDEARPLWDLYRSICQPLRVARIALRYINRIDIPVHDEGSDRQVQLQDYLSTYPQIADDLAHSTMSGFIMQVQIPQPDIESILVVNEALAAPPRPGLLSILLDLDLFRLGNWDTQDDTEVWSFFEQLRRRKNEVFEASITDETRRIIR